MGNSSKDKFTDKDLLQQLWDGRKFELEHFWQRSIFLASIFVVLIAGYGKIIFSLYFPESSVAENEDVLLIQHSIAWGITLLNLIFSMLWIMMAKGSKFWYERYEHSINSLLEKSSIFDNINKDLPCHGDLEYPPDDRYSDSLFSTHAGGFSVSKVNITIGIIGIFVFLLLNGLHFAEMLKIRFEDEIESFQCAMFSIVEVIVVFALLDSILRILCKSGEAK